jgi:phosphoribosylaminoimidazolecarboxamide formyltransferase/IMP cyclohydrolase
MEQATRNDASGTQVAVTMHRALISVWDKTGLDPLATGLAALGVEIVATGGTADALQRMAVSVTTVESLTGYPAILDGRVKTLHPAIFAALLGRDDPAHRAQLDAMGIAPIDLVVVNLYPFEGRAPTATMADAVELIDIGGVALLRAAAKNWERVAVVCDPSQYGAVLDELQRTGALSSGTRQRLAAAAFRRTASYDAAIAQYLTGQGPGFPERLVLAYTKATDLRYGENPHQGGAFYREVPAPAGTLADARQHQGKELSFNNLVDLDAAWGLVWEFDRPATAIIKHATPCGVAVADDLVTAYGAARDCDPMSAFGGIVACNREVDEPTAQAMTGLFTEAVIAPAYSHAALAVLARRPNLRVLACAAPQPTASLEVRSISGGLVAQEQDTRDAREHDVRVVTLRKPSADEMADLRFAWKVCKWAKSNAIVLARGGATVGIGSGQPNRVGAVELAVKVAGERARGAVLASDAFFPFRDGVDAAARAGVTAIIQPGGSVRDVEVMAAATEYGMGMVFTGIRHFRH